MIGHLSILNLLWLWVQRFLEIHINIHGKPCYNNNLN